MKIFLIVTLLVSNTVVFSQKFAVSNIPDSLKANADAVKRAEEFNIEVKSLQKVIVKRKYAITIFNENGDKYAQYYNNYSLLERLSDITGTLYDANGNKIRSVKSKDITDLSIPDGMTLMDDDRVKAHNFHHRQYPYTIEYEDEQLLRWTMMLPEWYPVNDESISVEQSRYTIEVPAGYKLRYRPFNYTAEPEISRKSSGDIYSWTLKNYPAVSFESFGPKPLSILPHVRIAPDDFAVGGYTGNMNTWLDFGKFQMALNKDRDILPDNIKQQVHELADKLERREEKINTLYQYLQKNTRYIGIQLGIGGWQPFDAKYVSSNKYGDCKALSNYMVSLLKEVGIKSHYVLIYAGDDYPLIEDDFPVRSFNHIVVCVPNGKDSIWLECTSQTKSPGYLGSSTGNRRALLIDDDGGHLVNTPYYSAEDNQQIRNVKAVIAADGTLQADINTHFTGTQQELQHSLAYEATKEQRDRYLNKAIGLPTYEVKKSEYKETKGRIPAMDEYLQIVSPHYATVSGKRMFIIPNLFNKIGTRLSEEKQRKYPIVISSEYLDIDSIQIEIPMGFILEAMPKDISLDNEFGKFSVRYEVTDSKIDIVRSNSRKPSSFSSEKYPELVKFYEQIYKSDHSRIVFVKKEN